MSDTLLARTLRNDWQILSRTVPKYQLKSTRTKMSRPPIVRLIQLAADTVRSLCIEAVSLPVSMLFQSKAAAADEPTNNFKRRSGTSRRMPVAHWQLAGHSQN